MHRYYWRIRLDCTCDSLDEHYLTDLPIIAHCRYERSILISRNNKTLDQLSLLKTTIQYWLLISRTFWSGLAISCENIVGGISDTYLVMENHSLLLRLVLCVVCTAAVLQDVSASPSRRKLTADSTNGTRVTDSLKFLIVVSVCSCVMSVLKPRVMQ